MVFCASTALGTTPGGTEKGLARCLRTLDPEPNPDWLNEPDVVGYVGRADLSVIETLKRLGSPHFADGPERANLIEISHHWRLNLAASSARPASLPLLRCPINEGYDPDKDETIEAIFGDVKPCEIAWASILLGNFPDVTASDLRHGVTIPEVIEKETHAIRAAHRRRLAGIHDRAEAIESDFSPARGDASAPAPAAEAPEEK